MTVPRQAIAPGSAAMGADLAGYKVWPRIGSVVTFSRARNDEVVKVKATIVTYYGRGDLRVFNLSLDGQVFQARFVTIDGKLRVAPIEAGGGTPVSYPCQIKEPRP
ncbi:MAG: hypothetical protein RLO01_12755 [Thalassobaculaceae bacterium]